MWTVQQYYRVFTAHYAILEITSSTAVGVIVGNSGVGKDAATVVTLLSVSAN